MRRRALLNVEISCLCLLAALFATGCGQSHLPFQISASSPAPAPAPRSVSISPDSLFIKRGNNWNFTAAVANTNDQTVSWTIQEGSAGGAISDSGIYTAPAAMGVYHIVATSKADPSKSATATVSVGTSGFTSTGNLADARFSHTATLLTNGKVYIAGGAVDSITDDDYLAVIEQDELFDSASGTFQPAGKLNRAYHTATRLLNGDVLFTGGFVGDAANGLTLSATAELLKADSGTFQPTGSMSVVRELHTATLLEDGTVLITGGYASGGFRTQTAELYDPASGKFASVGDMGAARAGHLATLLTNGKVLIIGGGVSGAELFDPATKSFTPAGDTSSANVSAATLLADGRVLISGETNSDLSVQLPAELYDPATGKFTLTGSMATLRLAFTATRLSDGTVLVAGGFMRGPVRTPAGYTPVPVNDSEIYNPATGVFSPGPTMRQARYLHTATLLPDGTVLFVGGRGGSCCSSVAATNSAEIYQ